MIQEELNNGLLEHEKRDALFGKNTITNVMQLFVVVVQASMTSYPTEVNRTSRDNLSFFKSCYLKLHGFNFVLITVGEKHQCGEGT